MQVTISKPAKTAMQSGSAKTKDWLVEGVADAADDIDPLMGWSSSHGTQRQIRLFFPSRDEAVRFAEERGWEYRVLPAQDKRIRPRNYADNFRYVPPPQADATPASADPKRPHSSTG
jgi:hypothetical protein